MQCAVRHLISGLSLKGSIPYLMTLYTTAWCSKGGIWSWDRRHSWFAGQQIRNSNVPFYPRKDLTSRDQKPKRWEFERNSEHHQRDADSSLLWWNEEMKTCDKILSLSVPIQERPKSTKLSGASNSEVRIKWTKMRKVLKMKRFKRSTLFCMSSHR